MRNIVIVLQTLILFSTTIFAASNVSAPIAFYIKKEVIPPNLNVVDNTFNFIDEDNNNVIDANERCILRFQVENIGKGDGHSCMAMVKYTGNISGISIQEVRLPVIPSYQKIWVEIPIIADSNTETGELALEIEITEPNDYGTAEPIKFIIGTHELRTPLVCVSGEKFSSEVGTLRKREPFNLKIAVQNQGQGIAENVKVSLIVPKDVHWYGGDEDIMLIPKLEPNESKEIEYELMANQKAEDNLLVKIELTEKSGIYAVNKNIPLVLGKYVGTTYGGNLTAIRKDPEVNITPRELDSKVDKNIPISDIENTKTFAFIIANEKYDYYDNVPYALDDGNIFKEYCNKTLGIPEKNIKIERNATRSEINRMVNNIRDICETHAQDNPRIIFYYAGHGVPNPKDQTSYLLPCDAHSSDISETGYKLDDLYKKLGELPASNVIVFLDACFSGSNRGNGTLASSDGSRWVVVEAKRGIPQGKVLVFAAAQGDETAHPYKEEGHGMFTYYLLEKLQKTEGNVTMYELGEYIKENVGKTSSIKEKRQTPSVIPSLKLGDSWKEWKLK